MSFLRPPYTYKFCWYCNFFLKNHFLNIPGNWELYSPFHLAFISSNLAKSFIILIVFCISFWIFYIDNPKMVIMMKTMMAMMRTNLYWANIHVSGGVPSIFYVLTPPTTCSFFTPAKKITFLTHCITESLKRFVY